MFSAEDKKLLKSKGISEEKVSTQIDYFKSGFPFMDIIAPATPSEGIKVLTSSNIKDLQAGYRKEIEGKRIVKFVPASGAATRMFKSLFNLKDEYKATNSDIKEFEVKKDDNFEFITRLQSFAFYSDLCAVFPEIQTALDNKEYQKVAAALLDESGLDYRSLPKGLLKFHSYGTQNRTPLEEHLVEGIEYAKVGNIVRLHFTVSGEHKAKFQKLTTQLIEKFKKTGVEIEVSFSEQKASTDTIAVNPDNTPFRDKSGELFFRPGGHGALIENLNEIDADVIFIKNIDNVVPDHLKSTTYDYKKALGGLLLSYQKSVFDLIEKLDTNKAGSTEEAFTFLVSELNVKPSDMIKAASETDRKAFILTKLNRPLRVCGMVKNEGEPGGGPFWCKNEDGSVSLQIVESAQINLKDAKYKSIVDNSTHFNPVDLVCATKDRNGKPFNLPDFVDPKTGFISGKSKDGKDLKALELPGLWNGAMANWNTIFVEVPVITFNPVKTVNDLLRPQHQPA